MLVLIMLTFSCHALCNCQGARGSRSEPSQPDAGMGEAVPGLPRKEVIQPHLPVRLPCYDFTPVIGPAFGSSFFAVRSLTSGVTDSHGVTGGVYKARERIHRGMLIRDY